MAMRGQAAAWRRLCLSLEDVHAGQVCKGVPPYHSVNQSIKQSKDPLHLGLVQPAMGNRKFSWHPLQVSNRWLVLQPCSSSCLNVHRTLVPGQSSVTYLEMPPYSRLLQLLVPTDYRSYFVSVSREQCKQEAVSWIDPAAAGYCQTSIAYV